MAIKASTALRNFMLDDSPLRTILNASVIRLYAGTPPTTADDAIGSATLLCTVSVNDTGDGVTFEPNAVNGVLAKNGSEVWSGTNVATGTATFYRHVLPTDDGAADTTDQPRIQGTIAAAGADLNLTNPNLVEDVVQTIDYYTIALPTL